MEILTVKTITGCDARGDGGYPYMRRYTILGCRWFQICLHYFFRSDHTDHHDHPWHFISIPLWNGYYEETLHFDEFDCPYVTVKRKYPGYIMFRRASHLHRVVLLENKRALTLVFMGKKFRRWGFFTEGKWLLFTKYFIKNGC